MNRIARITAAAVLAPLLFAACMMPDANDEAAREVYAQFRNGEFEALNERLIPELRGPETVDALRDLRRNYLPDGDPESVTLVQWNSFSSLGAGRTFTAVHDYTYPDRILRVTTVLVDSPVGGDPMIRTFHINVMGGAFLDAVVEAANERLEAGDTGDETPPDETGDGAL